MENPIEMDDLGVPLFFGNTHMLPRKFNNAVANSAVVTFLGKILVLQRPF